MPPGRVARGQVARGLLTGDCHHGPGEVGQPLSPETGKRLRPVERHGDRPLEVIPRPNRHYVQHATGE